MTSVRGEKGVARLAADANVLLSASCGKAALRVFRVADPPAILVPRVVVAEVQEYLAELAGRAGLPEPVARALLDSLPIEIVREGTYIRKMPEALSRIGARDPDDAHLLALALTPEVPIWSNDSAFRSCGVTVFTTARLLKALGT